MSGGLEGMTFETSLSLYPSLFRTSLLICEDGVLRLLLGCSQIPHFKHVPQQLFTIFPSSHTPTHLALHDPKILPLASSNCLRDLFHLNFPWFTHI